MRHLLYIPVQREREYVPSLFNAEARKKSGIFGDSDDEMEGIPQDAGDVAEGSGVAATDKPEWRDVVDDDED